MSKCISLIIPAYNESESVFELKIRIEAVINNIAGYDFEIIIVENGSHDSTYDKLLDIHMDDPRFKIVRLSRNFGCDGGITAGLQYAKGEAAILMCADLQDIPEMIPFFIKKWEEGYEIVCGIVQERVNISFTRKINSQLYYKIFNLLSDTKIPVNASDFRLIDRSVINVINAMGEKNRLLRGMIAWTGFKQAGIPFERPPRFAGESKANFITIFKLAINGLLSFSDIPLKIATVIGFIVAFLSFCLIIIELALFIIYGREVPGFTTLIILISAFFGVLFIILGIIGEYISRIYDEVKERPIFIIKETVGFEKL